MILSALIGGMQLEIDYGLLIIKIIKSSSDTSEILASIDESWPPVPEKKKKKKKKKRNAPFANQVDPESRLLQKSIRRARGYFNTARELAV